VLPPSFLQYIKYANRSPLLKQIIISRKLYFCK